MSYAGSDHTELGGSDVGFSSISVDTLRPEQLSETSLANAFGSLENYEAWKRNFDSAHARGQECLPTRYAQLSETPGAPSVEAAGEPDGEPAQDADAPAPYSPTLTEDAYIDLVKDLKDCELAT